MDDMVERVAKAIEGATGLQRYTRTAAIAAIEAMREPTHPMVRAATVTAPTWDDEASRRKWQVMIDAALQKDASNRRTHPMHDDRSSPVTATLLERLEKYGGRAVLSRDDIKQIVEALRSPAQSPLTKRPVAWRCKDYADGWIIFQDEAAAYKYHTETDCMMQGMYVRDGSPAPGLSGYASSGGIDGL